MHTADTLLVLLQDAKAAPKGPQRVSVVPKSDLKVTHRPPRAPPNRSCGPKAPPTGPQGSKSCPKGIQNDACGH